MYLLLLVLLTIQSATDAEKCSKKNTCTEYMTWGKPIKGDRILNFDTRQYQKEVIWEYNVKEKNNVVITCIEVNNMALSDCQNCHHCIVEGGVGYSYVKIGLTIPDFTYNESWYQRQIYGHDLKKGEKPKKLTAGNDLCQPGFGQRKSCSF